MAIELTDRAAAALPRPPTASRITYDTVVTGFGCRVTKAGTRSWVLRYRAGAIERLMTIGDVASWPAKHARARARELSRQVDGGGDPMAERHAERAAPTIADLADRFEREHMPRKRPATARDYRALIRDLIRPTLGRIKVADLRHADVERMHRGMVGRAPYRANRAVAVLSKMLSLGMKWELCTTNVARGIERAPEVQRKRYLTGSEIARLSDAVAAHPERTSANVVRLLLLSGARKSEALSARWQDLDLAAGLWTKPGSTTKQKTEHRIPLSASARALLAGMRTEADAENARRARDGLPPIEWVFPGPDGNHLVDIKHFWASICKKADLSGVRVHDLRHTYASILASAGLSLPVIGALLGHTQASTTQRYAHLMDDPLRRATERAGAIITGAGQAGAEVLALPAGRRA